MSNSLAAIDIYYRTLNRQQEATMEGWARISRLPVLFLFICLSIFVVNARGAQPRPRIESRVSKIMARLVDKYEIVRPIITPVRYQRSSDRYAIHVNVSMSADGHDFFIDLAQNQDLFADNYQVSDCPNLPPCPHAPPNATLKLQTNCNDTLHATLHRPTKITTTLADTTS